MYEFEENYDFSIFSDIKEIHCYGNVHGLTLPKGGGEGGEIEPAPHMVFVNNFIRIKLFKQNFGYSYTINDHIQSISI